MLIKLKKKTHDFFPFSFSFLSILYSCSFFFVSFVFCFVDQIRLKFVERLWLKGCRCHLSPSFSLINDIINYELCRKYTHWFRTFYWRRRHERRIFRRTYNIYGNLKLHILYVSHCRIQAEFHFISYNPLKRWNNVKRVYITSHQAVNIQAPEDELRIHTHKHTNLLIHDEDTPTPKMLVIQPKSSRRIIKIIEWVFRHQITNDF